MWVKMGVTKDGKITAAEGVFKFQAGAFPGSPVMNACLCAFAPYNIANAAHGRLRRRVQPAEIGRLPRAGLADLGLRGRERRSTCWRRRSAWTRCELRRKNAAGPARTMIYGPKLAHGGYVETARGLPQPSRLQDAARARTRGAASPRAIGSTAAANSSATVQINADGTILVATGSPDIGGSRASMALMAAETFGVDYNQVRAIVADTASVGYTHVTGGSRVTFATGMAVVDACKKLVDEMRARAAMIWGVDVEGVVWEDGHAKPASSNVGDFPPMSLQGDRRPRRR